MKKLTFQTKTVLGSLILVLVTLSVTGAIALTTLSNLNKSVALKSLQGGILTVKTAVQEIETLAQYEQIDPLPAGKIGLIRGPRGEVALDSIQQFNARDREILAALPQNTLQRFISDDQEFWVLNSKISSPLGEWDVLVL